MDPALRHVHGRCLELIDAHRFGELGGLVHETVTVDGQDVGRDTHAGGTVEDTAAIPDLHWSAAEVLADGETVPVRYVITGTPVRPWRGITPTGRTFAMQELISHHLRDGRLSATWSLVDVAGARTSSPPPSPGSDECPDRTSV